MMHPISLPSEGRPSSDASFRFLDLQPEICHEILGYTDLVTPHRHVRFDRRRLCAASVPSTHHPSLSFPDVNGASSWTWRPPVAMLLVSRAFSALAQAVLYSQNHFEVCQWTSTDLMLRQLRGERVEFPDECDAASFLSRPMRAQFLPSIASLEVHYPRVRGKKLITTRSLQQWQKMLERFKDDLKPRRLIINDIDSDNSIPIVKHMSHHRASLSRKFFSSADAIDLVRQSVDLLWPTERLTQPDGVQMFLWDLEHEDGEKLVYYCRHQSEPLPARAADMPLIEYLPGTIYSDDPELYPELAESWGPADIHVHRTFRVYGAGEHGQSRKVGTEERAGWLEGIWVRVRLDTTGYG